MVDIGGLIPPVISPLTPTLDVDRAGIRAVVERMIDAGVNGMFVLGSCGEGPVLTDRQRRSIVDGYAEEIAGRVPLFVGLPDPSGGRANDSRELLARAADVVVVGAPFYYVGASPEHVRNHVERALGDHDGQAVLYNIPQATGNAFTSEIFTDLVTSDSRIVGMKDSCAIPDASRDLQRTADRLGVAFLQGAEALMLGSLLRGAAGVIPGVANVFPEDARLLVDAVQAGRPEEGAKLQSRIDAQCESVYRTGHWLAALHASVAAYLPTTPALASGVPLLSAEETLELQRSLVGTFGGSRVSR